MLSKRDLSDKFSFPAYSSEVSNNGIIGYTNLPEFICDKNNPIFVVFGDHTKALNIVEQNFSVLDNVKVLKPIINKKKSLLFILSVWQKHIPSLGYARHWKVAKNCIVPLPTKNGEIDFDFMEKFISELEAARISELEAARISELEAYLLATGLKDYNLTEDEKNAVDRFSRDGGVIWKQYNVKALFGESTRGKRLKSLDRIAGELPFVTAGETDEGISAWIGNTVHIFSENTSTIDMFGSAKYRNYEFGADDHVAVVHTENLPVYSAIFITSALNKASHTGQFNYSRNFYAKDADELNISLPTKSNAPDYEIMETFISAIQKLVIKNVVLYADKRIMATKIATTK